MFRDVIEFQAGEPGGTLPRWEAKRAFVAGALNEPGRAECEVTVVIPRSVGGAGFELRLRGCSAEFRARVEAILNEPVQTGVLLPALADLAKLDALADESGVIIETKTGANYYDEVVGFIEGEIGRLTPELLRSAIEVREVAPGLLHLVFSDQAILAETMLRFQEYYESPRFHSTVFTRADFVAWYRTTQPHGGFSYHFDWPGFNVPARCFEPFARGDFPALSVGERIVLEKLTAYPGARMVIATCRGGDPDTFLHELAHGLFETVPQYRAEALRILDRIDRAPLYRILEGLGYAAHTWDDEIQAYLIGDRDELVDVDDPAVGLAEISAALRGLLERYRIVAAPEHAG